MIKAGKPAFILVGIQKGFANIALLPLQTLLLWLKIMEVVFITRLLKSLPCSTNILKGQVI
jgi:hypothetical protein